MKRVLLRGWLARQGVLFDKNAVHLQKALCILAAHAGDSFELSRLARKEREELESAMESGMSSDAGRLQEEFNNILKCSGCNKQAAGLRACAACRQAHYCRRVGWHGELRWVAVCCSLGLVRCGA